MVDRGDIDADRVRSGIKIHATIGGAAVVAHLEAEGGIAPADGVGRRREGEGGEAGGGDFLAGGDGDTVELKAARQRQAGENHALQRVGSRGAGGVDRVGEAEIGGGEVVGGVFSGDDRAVAAGRRVVHRGDIEADRVGRGIEINAAIGGASVIAYPEGERGNGAAVGVGRWRVGEGCEAGDRDLLSGGDCGTSEPQDSSARQAGDDHAL